MNTNKSLQSAEGSIKNTLDDTVGIWEIPLSNGIHTVQFEHGTTSGKRIIYVDGKEIKRDNFLFKLVGVEHFTVSNAKCQLEISVGDMFNYKYRLMVNGKYLDKFIEAQSKILQCWIVRLGENMKRIVLERDSMNVFVNGGLVDTMSEFTDEGTQMHFAVDGHSCYIETVQQVGGRPAGQVGALGSSSDVGGGSINPVIRGAKNTAIVHNLYINDNFVTPAKVGEY